MATIHRFPIQRAIKPGTRVVHTPTGIHGFISDADETRVIIASAGVRHVVLWSEIQLERDNTNPTNPGAEW